MPSTLSPTAVCNVSLSKIGAQAITSISDSTNASALACNNNFNLCYLEVSRSTEWNCLLNTAILVNVPQTPLPWSTTGMSTTITATAWAQNTSYLANVYVTFGGYYYQVVFNYKSSLSFINDLTTGALVQTDQPTSGNTFGLNDGSQYPSGWGYQYALPSDFQLLGTLNSNPVWDLNADSTGDDSGGDEFEIMGSSLFTDAATAVIQYVPNQPDCTQWDAMFTNAMSLKLASAVSTTLRQDGGKMEESMLQLYERALRSARAKNGGEQMAKRFNPIGSSRFNQARWGGVNG